MLSWKVTDKDDCENADGCEGLSVTLVDEDGDEGTYSVDRATFDVLQVGQVYGLNFTPIPAAQAVPAQATPAAADPSPTAVQPDAAPAPAATPAAS